MMTIQLPVDRMSLEEVLFTALGLSIEGHELAAEELIKQWAKED